MELTWFNKDSDALFSEGGKRRLVLWRIWDRSLPLVAFIGLNPSKADGENDDPTIRRVKRFAKDWGYGGVVMLNLFTMITPFPYNLILDQDNKLNNQYLKSYGSLCQEVVFAWGNFKEARNRSREVIKMFPDATALHINKNGSPKHPLYVRADIQRVKFKK